MHVQRFGTFLSNMIMPNIAAFIAWGFITALFIEAGWITLVGDKVFGYVPGLEDGQYDYGFVSSLGGWDADGGGIVGPMITYLLPILIGYTGGRMMLQRQHPWRCRRRDRHHGRDHRGERPDVPRRDDHGSARRLHDEEHRRPVGRQDQARASRCWSTTSRPASGA